VQPQSFLKLLRRLNKIHDGLATDKNIAGSLSLQPRSVTIPAPGMDLL
jgi:hypothetical protein